MMLHEINAGKVVTHKKRRRVGRGESSGWGKTSGRGNKGMGQHSSKGPNITHEGGATPYYRKMPKRGFSNFAFRKEYRGINIATLDELFEADQVVDLDAMEKANLISVRKGSTGLVKILAHGTLTKPLTVKAHKFSEKAAEAIKAAGGQVEVIGKQAAQQ
ncbi:MAG: 50S ribosomal protein L15 [Phycisphaerae bacterium]|jgi:large subunit ribosomal protein L15|nr:50S ribosomal protein L15 [Phycisphaerae bacterium]